MDDLWVEDHAWTSAEVAQYLLTAVQVTPSYLVFSNAGDVLQATLKNSGAVPITIPVPPSFGGFNAFDFSISNGTTCMNGTAVQPNGSCVITVQFHAHPLTSSAESATLIVSDDASGIPQTASLSTGPAIASLAPNPVLGIMGLQTVTLTANNFSVGDVLNYHCLGRDCPKPSYSQLQQQTSNILTASLPFTNFTRTWEIQIAPQPGNVACGKDGSDCYSFQDIGSDFPYLNDYPFQSAAYDPTPLPSCKRGLAIRMASAIANARPMWRGE
jgi:hypothetical protein